MEPSERFEQLVSFFHVCPRLGGGKYFFPNVVFIIAYLFDITDTITSFMKSVKKKEKTPRRSSLINHMDYLFLTSILEKTRLYKGQSITHALIYHIKDVSTNKTIYGHAFCSSLDIDKFNIQRALHLARNRALEMFKEHIGDPVELGMIPKKIHNQDGDHGEK